MSLLKEAVYLYVHAKELEKVNRKLKNLGRKAEKHAGREHRAISEEKKYKHRQRYSRAASQKKQLMRKHGDVISILRDHCLDFKHLLDKEPKN